MSEAVLNFDRLVAMDRRAVRVYLAFSALVLLAGILIAGASFTDLFAIADTDKKWLQGLGGGFIAATSSFPIKECVSRLNRIDMLRATEELWRQMVSRPDTPKSDLDRIKEIVWKLYEKGLTG